MNKTIIMLLFTIGAIRALAQDIAVSWDGGDGTKENPYRIATIEQLRKLSHDSSLGIYHDNEYFVLTANIEDNAQFQLDADGWPVIGQNNEWVNIAQFNGHLDGAGHSISGLCGGYPIYYGWNGDSACLISSLKGSISNLVVKNSFLGAWVGVGDKDESLIYNCVNYATTYAGFSLSGVNELRDCGNYGTCYRFGLSGGFLYRAVNCYNMGTVNCMGCTYKDPTMTYKSRGSGMFNVVYCVENCMNMGNVVSSDTSSGIAHTFRKSQSYSNFSNLVNYGTVTNKDGSTSCGIAYTCENYHDNGKFENLYALAGSSSVLIENDSKVAITGDHTFKTTIQMRSAEFLQTLNNNAEALGDHCCSWIVGNNGFPVLEIVESHQLSGISSPETDCNGGPRIYYNLQGIRVENPTSGVYIRKQGRTTEKVLIK